MIYNKNSSFYNLHVFISNGYTMSERVLELEDCTVLARQEKVVRDKKANEYFRRVCRIVLEIHYVECVGR